MWKRPPTTSLNTPDLADRPPVITLIGLLTLADAVGTVLYYADHQLHHAAGWIAYGLPFSLLLLLGGTYGLWMLRRWGARTYLVGLVLMLLLGLAVGSWSPWFLAVRLVLALLVLVILRELD